MSIQKIIVWQGGNQLVLETPPLSGVVSDTRGLVSSVLPETLWEQDKRLEDFLAMFPSDNPKSELILRKLVESLNSNELKSIVSDYENFKKALDDILNLPETTFNSVIYGNISSSDKYFWTYFKLIFQNNVLGEDIFYMFSDENGYKLYEILITLWVEDLESIASNKSLLKVVLQSILEKWKKEFDDITSSSENLLVFIKTALYIDSLNVK